MGGGAGIGKKIGGDLDLWLGGAAEYEIFKDLAAGCGGWARTALIVAGAAVRASGLVWVEWGKWQQVREIRGCGFLRMAVTGAGDGEHELVGPAGPAGFVLFGRLVGGP